jgi:hypothetical protein
MILVAGFSYQISRTATEYKINPQSTLPINGGGRGSSTEDGEIWLRLMLMLKYYERKNTVL